MDNERGTADRRGAAGAMAIALLAGGVALLLLFPAGVLTSNPPQCVGLFTERVPCGLGRYVQAPSSLQWLTFSAVSFSAGLLVAVFVHAMAKRAVSAVAPHQPHTP